MLPSATGTLAGAGAGSGSGPGSGPGPGAGAAADDSSRWVLTAELLMYVVSWYVASAVCNTSARRLLTTSSHPLWLCVAQFATAFACLRAFFAARPDLRTRAPAEAHAELRRLAAAYTVGFVFVNAGYVAVNVSLAETLRSAEPLFSVAFTKLWLKDEYVSGATVMSLVPIVVGGALSSGSDASFNLAGLLFVCVSNTAFALRSVFTKHLRRSYAGDALNVFYEITLLGLVWLVPAALAVDAGTALLASPRAPEPPLAPRTMPGSLAALDAPALRAFLAMVAVNGLAYFLYNQMSFLVLSKVTVVTHAVANSLRRVVTILASVWYFRNPVSAQNALGIALAVLGVLAYSVSKSRDDAAARLGGKV